MIVYRPIAQGFWQYELASGVAVIAEEFTSLGSLKTFAALAGSRVVHLPSCRILVTPFLYDTAPEVRRFATSTGCTRG
jgi:hypothetical protein